MTASQIKGSKNGSSQLQKAATGTMMASYNHRWQHAMSQDTVQIETAWLPVNGVVAGAEKHRKHTGNERCLCLKNHLLRQTLKTPTTVFALQED